MNATTIATQAVNAARTRFSRVEAVALPQSVFEAVLEEVTAAGGEVGFDHAVVDGVPVRGGLDDEDRRARVDLADRVDAEWVDL